MAIQSGVCNTISISNTTIEVCYIDVEVTNLVPVDVRPPEGYHAITARQPIRRSRNPDEKLALQSDAKTDSESLDRIY